MLAFQSVKTDDGFLIAASGGMDSTVLVKLCSQAGLRIELAHCNFGLRGEESERDEQFVRSLAAELKTPFHVKKFNTQSYAEENKISIQEAARELRYKWFQFLIKSNAQLNWVMTAHHREDNAETIAMNFFRGTGLKGLMGIPPKAGKIIRPLLGISRVELEGYAAKNKLDYITDSTNLKEDYTRNYFRHTIIPAVEKIFPNAMENLVDNSLRAQQTDRLIYYFVDQFRSKYLLKIDNEFQISISQLLKFENTSLLYELLTPYGFSPGQINDASLLLHARTGAQLQAVTGEWRLIKNRKWLILTPSLPKLVNYFSITNEDTLINFIEGELLINQFYEKKINFDNEEHACLDLHKLEFPLTLRKWKEGDYFYPLGMPKKKKISRFLIDCKLSVSEKEKVWVLLTGDKICWVVGYRIDDRFKLTNTTASFLQIIRRPVLS